jgi:hypothetical protein
MLERLGRFVVHWSLAERLVEDILVHLTNAEPALMTVVTANVSKKSISEWVTTLLDVTNDPQDWSLEVRDVLSEIDDLRPERNMLVHGLWSTDSAPGSVVVQKIRIDSSEMVQSVLVTAADLDHLIDRTLAVSTRLLALVESLRRPL